MTGADLALVKGGGAGALSFKDTDLLGGFFAGGGDGGGVSFFGLPLFGVEGGEGVSFLFKRGYVSIDNGGV